MTSLGRADKLTEADFAIPPDAKGNEAYEQFAQAWQVRHDHIPHF